MVRKDLKHLGISESDWYGAVQNRVDWRRRWSAAATSELQQLDEARKTGTTRSVVCLVCDRTFQRESDKARHKCLDERRKPVSAQAGSVRCDRCGRWFKSRGGLAVHKCRRVGD